MLDEHSAEGAMKTPATRSDQLRAMREAKFGPSY